MNPYEVLGVPEDADEATIKKAYRDLVKKYHPDKYVNNPLADLATEKLKEVNKAYDMLMNKGPSASYGYNSQGNYRNSGSYSNSRASSYAAVRNLINRGMFSEAEQMLSGLPKNAEWNFLMGICRIRAGWYDSGIEFLRTASRMEPGNAEYSSTLNSVLNAGMAYRNTGTVGRGGMSGCDICSSLICADCCCECMGGDLISCC